MAGPLSRQLFTRARTRCKVDLTKRNSSRKRWCRNREWIEDMSGANFITRLDQYPGMFLNC